MIEMSCGCRIIPLTHHLKDFDFGFTFSSSSSFIKIKTTHHFPSYNNHKYNNNNNITGFLTSFSTVSSFPFLRCHAPILNYSSFSQKDDEGELSSEVLSSVAGGIVALGKFDALHIGHRELAIQASKAGTPFLLSFAGMAEVLGWSPRAPIVAQCDRQRVLSSWAPYCGNVSPKECLIDFASVRHLTPQQFVEKLSEELGVRGVVAGENYRFGYKAAGDASELVRLCDECGIQAYIINSVMDKNQDIVNSALLDKKERGQVSSTRVRYALSKGDMSYVSELLGRSHRLILSAGRKEDFVGSDNRLSAPRSCLLNLSPKEGLYENCSLIFDDESELPCRVVIDSTYVHIESDENDTYIRHAHKSNKLLGIEFRN